LLTHTIKLNKI